MFELLSRLRERFWDLILKPIGPPPTDRPVTPARVAHDLPARQTLIGRCGACMGKGTVRVIWRNNTMSHAHPCVWCDGEGVIRLDVERSELG